MAQNYNEMRVVGYDEGQGSLDLVWYDADGGPVRKQTILRRSHMIPMEAETGNWTREQLKQHFLLEVEDVADVPNWAKDEGDSSEVIEVTRVIFSD